VSPVVQASESSQDRVLFVLTQPLELSHVSVVQMLPSSQSGTAPPTQAPAAQVSTVVQASPSSQEAVLLVLAQPLTVSQVSVVHGLLSSQSAPLPLMQAPSKQVSFTVHSLPSSQESVLLPLTQPVAVLQESLVQIFESSQSVAEPLMQVPPAHISPVVQASESSQDAVLLVLIHPLATSQLSVVQTLPSSQMGAAPPTQTPPAQVSFVVQALESLQASVLLAFTQPVAVLQLSVVHTLLSLHERAGPD